MLRKILLAALLLINSPPKLSCKGAWQFPVQILSLAEERETWGGCRGGQGKPQCLFQDFFYPEVYLIFF